MHGCNSVPVVLWIRSNPCTSAQLIVVFALSNTCFLSHKGQAPFFFSSSLKLSQSVLSTS